MKKGFHPSVSVFLALMVLLSTVSWTVDKHLCMGKVMDLSFFVSAKDCATEAAMDALEDELDQNGCCEDESFTLKGQDDLKFSWSDLDVEQQIFLVAFLRFHLELFLLLEQLPVANDKYPPPMLVMDIHVLDQVFLI
ncbi:HYC_CC_PP family protein [Flagellimonas meishanensis]|uniref:HYC_CC_PP family protein n=1 Tax=Flagellimonas meishanensis TaxID=2873264 RepID=UPI00223B75CA|nr:hypothetical protein [[Muricauda] meishanensis]